MFIAAIIAILNMWRGRGTDINPKLNKPIFLVLCNTLLLNAYTLETAILFNLVFGFIFCFGTGEMIQAIHGKQQTPKAITKPIYWVIGKFTSLQGRLCGVLFNTVLGAIQALLVSVFGFTSTNMLFLLNGIIIYLLGRLCIEYLKLSGKAWQSCEYVLGFVWTLLVILAIN